MKRIVFTDDSLVAPDLLQKILSVKGIQFTYFMELAADRDELYTRGKDADIIITDIFSNYDKDMLSRWPKLKTIISAPVGTDYIDMEYCKKSGIDVISFPGFNSRAVAEMAFANLISLLRKIPYAQRHVLAGGWDFSLFEGKELKGKTLGIIGAGHVGAELIQIGKGFGMKIFCHTKHPSAKRARQIGLNNFSSLAEVMSKSDFVVIAISLNKTSRNIINSAALRKMKKCAYLINVARAPLVDIKALADAVYNSRIAGAALDVVGPEPFNLRKADPLIQEFLNSPNVILTPHIAWNTREAQERLTERIIETVKRLVKG